MVTARPRSHVTMKWSWRERPRTVPRPRATAAGLWDSVGVSLTQLISAQSDAVSPGGHRRGGPGPGPAQTCWVVPVDQSLEGRG